MIRFKTISNYLALTGSLLLLTNCMKQNAQKFYNYLDSAEHRVFIVMVSDSSERKRLQALNDDNPKLAKEIALSQITGLNDVISDIQNYNVKDIESAQIVKASTVSYYLAYREYKLLDTVDAYLLQQSLNNVDTVEQNYLFMRTKIAKIDSLGKLDQLRNKLVDKFKHLHGIK